MKCVIIDDEPHAIRLLQNYLGRIQGLELQQTFTDAISAGEFLRQSTTDLLLTDIQMPDINGLNLVHSLEHPPMVIFTTAYRNYAVEGFELDAVDYLVKPISFDRFLRAIEKARARTGKPVEQTPASIVIYADYRMIRIPLDDIIYVESVRDYVKIHRKNERPVMTLMTLQRMTELLPAPKFERIHRSFIVSVTHVKSIVNRKVQINASLELPVSDSYSAFINRWKSAC